MSSRKRDTHETHEIGEGELQRAQPELGTDWQLSEQFVEALLSHEFFLSTDRSLIKEVRARGVLEFLNKVSV